MVRVGAPIAATDWSVGAHLAPVFIAVSAATAGGQPAGRLLDGETIRHRWKLAAVRLRMGGDCLLRRTVGRDVAIADQRRNDGGQRDENNGRGALGKLDESVHAEDYLVLFKNLRDL